MNLIVAVDENYGIGKNGSIPWYNTKDLQFFRKTTLNSTIVMGRKTFESIGKPLPKRRNIVLTTHYLENSVEQYDSFEKIEFSENETIFIIGGESIYKYALNNLNIDRIYLSKIKGSFDCDRFFNFDKTKFKIEKIINEEDLYVEILKKF